MVKKEEIRILLVDDEPDILEIIRFNLTREGYKVFTANDGKEAIDLAILRQPHLIILDIMMPKMDGIQTCEKLREDGRFNDAIILFLTARGEEYSQLAAYDVGADDYVTKPIKPKVLVSKIKSLLRRLNDRPLSYSTIQFDEFIIDKEAHSVSIEGNIINLPRKEFKILFLLASQPGKVFQRDRILNYVWGDNQVGERTIDVHMRKLREKIGKKYIKTIKGVGYKFTHFRSLR